jgi:hypothetical protein
MRSSCLIHPCRRFRWVRIAFVTILTLPFCGWNNCTAIIGFNSCPSTVPQPVIVSVLPDTISDDESVPLTANGTEFIPQSQIMWNGNALQTTFIDSSHLQATVTKRTFESFGGSVGNTVQISVRSPEPIVVVGCPSGLTSGTVVVFIN